MNADHYAQALYYALRGRSEEEADILLNNFVAVIREHGHEKLLPAIVQSYEKLSRSYGAHDGVRITVARREDADLHHTSIAVDLAALRADSSAVRTDVDPTLIGGYSIEANGERIDATYKSALLSLYHSLVTQ